MTASQDDLLDLVARVHLTALREQPLDVVAVPAGRLDHLDSWSAPGWRRHDGPIGMAVDLVVVDDDGTDPRSLGQLRPGGLVVIIGDADGTDRFDLTVVDRIDGPGALTVLRAPTGGSQVPSPLAAIRQGQLARVPATAERPTRRGTDRLAGATRLIRARAGRLLRRIRAR